MARNNLQIHRRSERTHWRRTGKKCGGFYQIFTCAGRTRYIKIDDYHDTSRYFDTIPVFTEARLIRDGVKIE